MNFLTFICIIFLYFTVYSNNITTSDREEACIISANSIINLENPYSKTTHFGNNITTGINMFLAVPFIYLFGNYKHLTFLFWLILLLKFQPSPITLFILSPFIFRTIYLRLDEFYFFAIMPQSFVYFLLSRNWHNVFNNVSNITHFYFLDYILIIPLFYKIYYKQLPIKYRYLMANPVR